MRTSVAAVCSVLFVGCVGDTSAPGPDASNDVASDTPSSDGGAEADGPTEAAPPKEAGGATTVASVPIFRGIVTDANTYADHLYTADESELSKLGYTEDTPHPFFYFAANAGPFGALHELDRCSNPNAPPVVRHTLGIDGNCFETGFSVDGPLGFVATDLQSASHCGATQFVKLYRAQVGDRVFTNLQAEITSLEGSGYVDETSFVAYAWTSSTITCYP